MFSLPDLIAGIMLIALTAYVLFGGADFGGGVWDFLAAGPRRNEQRELIARAMGPIWEANHVWLILVIVLLFTCFPAVFATLAVVLHVPLTLMLIGIVLRGSAFTFRVYGGESDLVARRWGRVFSVSSIITPILLGVCIGTIASGHIGTTGSTSFVDGFIMPWLTPFALSTGILALTLFAFLAATYLTVESVADAPLQEDFRRRALLAGVAVFALAFLTLFLARAESSVPRLELSPGSSVWGLVIHAATAIAALTALWSLWTRRYQLARTATAGQVSLMLWGWAVEQYPYLIPPTHTIADNAAPARTLELVLVALLAGFVILVPSIIYLFRVFKRSNLNVNHEP
jgi:cytochrome d ubiquinol oxidase subunit II